MASDERCLAAEHAACHLDAVVQRILARLSVGQTGVPTPEWLQDYRGVALGGDADLGQLDQLDSRLAALESGAGDQLPLAAIGRGNAMVLAAAGLIEEDIRFGSLFASLQEPLPARRPCFGLLAWLLADRRTSPIDVMIRCHSLAEAGLLAIDNPTEPRSEWVARVPISVWDLIGRGMVVPSSLPSTLELRTASSFPELEEVIVPRELSDRLPRISALLAAGELSTLVARGPRTSGRLTLLGAMARRARRDVIVHRGAVGDEGWQLLGPLARLSGAMAVTVVSPGPGETIEIPALPGCRAADAQAPVSFGIVVGRHGGLSGAALEGALSLTLGGGGPEDRLRMWREGGLAAGHAELTDIAERFVLTPGNIRRAAPVAMALAAVDGRDRAGAADVLEATGALSRQVLETLATRLSPIDPDAEPVLAPVAADELRTLLSLCRHREHLAGAVGPAARTALGRGVRALFSGPSGTGKTLAARYVAAQLGLDLYRVDLASVVSKYIGETERNLDQVLSRAEELDVVLLLDEGDALMTRRTEVGNANDRYANLETNFLLQRLESFEGIAIITTNAANRIDTAFQRRIDVTVELGPPDPQARMLIWLNHLPPDHTISQPLLDQVSRRCALNGGRIRNAALHASLLSVEDGRPIGDEDLVAAVRREYRRMGATSPLGIER
jgi:hypothetical protein